MPLIEQLSGYYHRESMLSYHIEADLDMSLWENKRSNDHEVSVVALHPIKTSISNLVCTMRFWNNLHLVRLKTVSGIIFIWYA